MNVFLRLFMGTLLFGNVFVVSATAQPTVSRLVPDPMTPFVFPKGLVALWQTELMCPSNPPGGACTVTINGIGIDRVQQLSLAHVSQSIAGTNVREFLFYRIVQDDEKVYIGLIPFVGGAADVRVLGLSQTSAGGAGTTMPYAGR